MSEPSDNISDESLRKTLGDLTEAELTEIRGDITDGSIDPAVDMGVDDLLRKTAALGPVEGDVPPVPEKARQFFESQREAAFAELEEQEAELEASIFSQPRRSSPEPERASFFRRLPFSLGILGAAAAVVVAVVSYNSQSTSGIPVTVAEAVTLLTPGEVTGFTEPIFTWKADNGGVVDVEIVEKGTGATVASLENAFSPLRWSALQAEERLRPDAAYELRITGSGKSLAERVFQTASVAEGSPTPEGNLDAIISQCEKLIAENRPADAWMLWGELTASQKSDGRMQALKERILKAIAA